MTVLAPNQFKKIAKIAQDQWGLHLTDRKIPLVSNRLAKFIRKSPYADMESYIRHIEHEATEEDMLAFFDLLSTNVTSFFRERQHFDYLEREFYTALARGNLTTPGRQIRMWSAACSTGPEPYTMAMHAIEHLPDYENWDIKILATDLSTSAINDAKVAMYPEKMVEDIPKSIMQKYFLRGTGANKGMVKVAEEVRRMVTIRRLNLMESWPFQGPFQVIFCRNMMIYIDRQNREQMVRKFYNMLSPGGILAIGSSETLSGLDTKFKTVQPSVYMKD